MVAENETLACRARNFIIFQTKRETARLGTGRREINRG